MAQRRYWNYKDDDSTNDMNHWFLAMIPPGVYAGFDNAAFGNNLSLSLVQTQTGVLEVDINAAASGPFGVCRTQQGTIFQEDAAIGLTIAANSTGQPRIDLIVLEHAYVQTPGGTAGSYKVITGTPATTPVPPALTFPTRQIIIGSLYMPAGTTALNGAGVIYTKSGIPFFGGDSTVVHTNVAQEITARKQLDSWYGKIGVAQIINTTQLQLVQEGNVFVVANVNDSFVTIDTIVPLFTAEGYAMEIITFQKLKLVNTGNIHLGVTETENNVYLEAGESFKLIDLNTIAGLTTGAPGGSSPRFLLERGGDAKKAADTKHTGTQKWSKGIATLASSAVTLASSGNYFEVVIASGGPDIGYLPALSADYAGVLQAGAMIMLKITVTGVSALPNLTNNKSAVPTGYKAVSNPNGANIPMSNGDVLILIEDETTWRLINITGIAYNPISIIAQINAIKTSNVAFLLGLEPNLILTGGIPSSVMTGPSTENISAGVAFINGDYRVFNAYSGIYPAYLGLDPANPTAQTAIWSLVSTDPANEVVYDPYTSQYTKYAIKRASMDIGDVKLSSVLSGDFDSTGLGKWSQKGFALCNNANGAINMQGQVPVGLRDDTVDISNPEWEYRTMLNTLGNKTYALIAANIPPLTSDGFISTGAGGTHGAVLVNAQTNTQTIGVNSTSPTTALDMRQKSTVLAYIQRIAV